jgi:predicted RNase H-like nuclease (RuvC/YqgF family)
MECPICQEPGTKSLGCGHGVCAECYPKIKVSGIERNCPLCRRPEVLPVEEYRKIIRDLTRENEEYARTIDTKTVSESLYKMLDEEYAELNEKYKQQKLKIRSLEYDLAAAKEEVKELKQSRRKSNTSHLNQFNAEQFRAIEAKLYNKDKRVNL